MQSIHGHEVLRMILDAEPFLTRQELTGRIEQMFGAGARFHTCSANGMDLDELLHFLTDRKKIVEHQGVLQPGAHGMCSHG